MILGFFGAWLQLGLISGMLFFFGREIRVGLSLEGLKSFVVKGLV